MEADGGDPGHAVEVARDVNTSGLTAVALSRQTAFYVDTARALSNIGKDTEALRMLLLAERIAPQRVRLSPLVAETVRALLEKAKRGRGWADFRAVRARRSRLVNAHVAVVHAGEQPDITEWAASI